MIHSEQSWSQTHLCIPIRELGVPISSKRGYIWITELLLVYQYHNVRDRDLIAHLGPYCSYFHWEACALSQLERSRYWTYFDIDLAHSVRLLDMVAPLKEKEIYQGCSNPDCRLSSSGDWNLPNHGSLHSYWFLCYKQTQVSSALTSCKQLGVSGAQRFTYVWGFELILQVVTYD